jgi:uncharacterized protein
MFEDFLIIFALALFMEMVDNGLGGGFGTILSPVFIILGYDPTMVVSSILVSEAISGLWGGAWHLKFKNVNFKAYGVTLTGSLIAMTVASIAIGVLLPKMVVKWYISIVALLMGLFVIYKSYRTFKPLEGNNFSKWKCWLLGFIVGFNKGSTGGGYGPLSVSGYILLGIPAAVAIGTTTIAEGTACVIGIVTYGATSGFVLSFLVPLALGAFIADPVSAWLNHTLKRKVEPPFHGRLVGVVMLVLGCVTILKLLGVF